MARMFPLFTGNCPHNVSKDAKYVIRSGRGGPEVALTYISDEGEQWLATTQGHPDLVKMVNDVKTTMGMAANGPFYINEFSQVIVPVGEDATYYLAGEYDLPLRFTFEGHVLSGEGVDLQGNALSPGDRWVGPHPGVPYILEAGGGDIRYESHPRPGVTRKIQLSTALDREQAVLIARRIRAVKDWSGGRFYVNEWSEMFAPVREGGSWEYGYIGHLEEGDPWFPKP